MLKSLKQYWGYIFLILIFSLTTNGLSLYFPKKIGEYIDLYQKGNAFQTHHIVWVLGWLTLAMVLSALLQFVVSSFTSEKVGKELRFKLIKAIKDKSFVYIREITSSKLITILTSDVDAIKTLISAGLVSILTAAFSLFGTIIFLLVINWKLALATLFVIPFIILSFALIFRKIGEMFGASQLNLDKINKVINESIIAAPLVRVLNAEKFELKKFDEVNLNGTNIAKKIVSYFAALVPIIMFLSSLSILVVLYYGGLQVTRGNLTLGEMSAFFSYTSFFIWPFFVLAFSSQFVSRAQVSFDRINLVLKQEDQIEPLTSKISEKVKGKIEFKNVTLKYGEKEVLKNVSFVIESGTKTAIVGPTGAGKTELYYLISSLAAPSAGEILIDDIPIKDWNQSSLLPQIGLVFQDSIIFQTTLKENILFNTQAKSELLNKAIETADLQGLMENLKGGLNADVSERGMTLSGGQKQRVMLARALTLNPKILLLDDFTARVDSGTEERILHKLEKNFPNLTLVSITQKIEPIKNYQKILVLMEGELIAEGKHNDLLLNSIEYKQIYESQHTTS